jgi:16S rRNA (cytosine1402-N4)-methyltransferase
VNDELGSLERALPASVGVLKPGGRLAVISFHSLEDRIVKQFIRGPQPVAVRRGLPAPPSQPAPLRAIARAQRPDADEVERNPRARSAVLRIAEKNPSEASPPGGLP